MKINNGSAKEKKSGRETKKASERSVWQGMRWKGKK